jgi:hypothetical protein
LRDYQHPIVHFISRFQVDDEVDHENVAGSEAKLAGSEIRGPGAGLSFDRERDGRGRRNFGTPLPASPRLRPKRRPIDRHLDLVEAGRAAIADR